MIITPAYLATENPHKNPPILSLIYVYGSQFKNGVLVHPLYTCDVKLGCSAYMFKMRHFIGFFVLISFIEI